MLVVSQSDVPSSSHSEIPMSPMSPMSECDSTVFSEGNLTTTDSKEEKPESGIEQTFFQNGTCVS